MQSDDRRQTGDTELDRAGQELEQARVAQEDADRIIAELVEERDRLRRDLVREESARAAAEAAAIVPEIRHLNIIRTWTGVDGDTEDGSPIVGHSATTPGLFHAFGFCGHGFQLGPGVGAVLSELIVDGRSDTDIHGLGIARFDAGR